MLPFATYGLFLALVPQSEPRCPIATFVASDTEAGDGFGGALSISGDTLAVGARRDDDLGWQSGSAYVFHRDDNSTPGDPTDDTWIELAKLHASDGKAGDQFGESLVLKGGTLLVAAARYLGTTSLGSVYAFERDDNGTPGDPLDDSWVEIDRLDPSNPVPLLPSNRDGFGHALALSGNTVLVGAKYDSQVAPGGGAAYVFERDDNGTPGDPFDDSWVEIVKLTRPVGTSNSFGNEVGLQGNTAFVGCHTGGGPGVPGVVYVFERDDKGTPGDPFDDEWLATTEVRAEDPIAWGLFGFSICPQEDELLVGSSPGGTSPTEIGAAYFFARDDQGTPDPFDDTWVQYEKVSGSDTEVSDWFGAYTIWLVGDLALVGATLDDDRGKNSGSAYAFQRDDRGTPELLDDVWTEICKMAPVTGESGDYFGEGSVLFGREALIGAKGVGAQRVDHFDLDRPCDAFAGLRTQFNRNPICLTSTSEPRLGEVWEVQVDNTVHSAPLMTMLLAYDRPLSPRIQVKAGDLLVDLSSAIHLKVTTLSSITGIDLFRFLVPDDEPSLIGLHTFAQAAVVGRGESHLCNALNIVLGY